MKIYTKHGDAGETGLFGGERVSKDHLRIRAYGTLDEANAAVGIAIAALGADPIGKKSVLNENLARIQGELFQLGAELATPRGKKISIALVEDAEIAQLETEIDAMEASLPPLKSFVLPGGCLAAAHLHLARTIARRAERELVVLHRSESLRAPVLRYVNRLSDYFFVASRFSNHEAKISDIPWTAPPEKPAP